MTSWRHSVTRLGQIKISQLYLVNGTWGYGKMALLVEAKIFSYKINLILCHNVNFDVTIMTSWRHFFRSTFWWVCRQIISRKSHRRNFFNLLPFKSYRQKSKSWVIFPPLYPIRVKTKFKGRTFWTYYVPQSLKIFSKPNFARLFRPMT